jgi:polysaccharide chain length determinant protein (PEP-CTERM system associated)
MLGHRSLNVEDYLGILKRRWWLILIPGVVFCTVAYAVTFFIQPQFESKTLVLIEQQHIPTDLVKPLVTEDLDSRLASMKEQIKSRSSLEPIIQKFHLYEDQHLSMDARIALAGDNIGIDPIHSDIARSNGLPGFFISFIANDAHTAQLVCSDVESLFIKQNEKSRADTVDDTTAFFRSQLADAKRVLDDQDKKLADFQSRNFGKLPTDESNNVSIINALTTQLNADSQAVQSLEQNRTLMEAMLAQQSAPTTQTSGPATQTPQAQQSELEKLQATETELLKNDQPEHPDVKAVRRKIADLQKQIDKAASAPPPAPVAPSTSAASHADSVSVQAIRANLAANYLQIQNKNKDKEQIEQQIRHYEGLVQSTPQVDEEFKQLTRDTAASQANYDNLSSTLIHSNIASDLERRQQGETFQVRDPPTLPDGPFYPKKGVFVGGGLGAGIGIGLLLSALLEYKDTVLRSERDVWAFTQLPTLAVIAWSGDVADVRPSRLVRLKRLFGRKQPKEQLADAPG